jgi:hypothetical protein
MHPAMICLTTGPNPTGQLDWNLETMTSLQVYLYQGFCHIEKWQLLVPYTKGIIQYLSFVTGLLHFVKYPKGSSMVKHVSEFLPCEGWVTFHCMHKTHLFLSIYLSVDSGLLPCLDYCEYHYHEHGCENVTLTSCRQLFGYTWRSGWLYHNSICKIFMNYHTIFHGGDIISHFQE